jgi:hypothetical protein
MVEFDRNFFLDFVVVEVNFSDFRDCLNWGAQFDWSLHVHGEMVSPVFLNVIR